MRFGHYILTLAIALGLVAPALACCCVPAAAAKAPKKSCCSEKEEAPSGGLILNSFDCHTCACCLHSAPTPGSVPAPVPATTVKPVQLPVDLLPLAVLVDPLPYAALASAPDASPSPTRLSRHVLFCTYRC
jgi:hypothetical protein